MSKPAIHLLVMTCYGAQPCNLVKKGLLHYTEQGTEVLKWLMVYPTDTKQALGRAGLNITV